MSTIMICSTYNGLKMVVLVKVKNEVSWNRYVLGVDDW